MKVIQKPKFTQEPENQGSYKSDKERKDSKKPSKKKKMKVDTNKAESSSSIHSNLLGYDAYKRRY
jgi:hypothetical protein